MPAGVILERVTEKPILNNCDILTVYQDCLMKEDS
jgi:hypothetical protein